MRTERRRKGERYRGNDSPGYPIRSSDVPISRMSVVCAGGGKEKEGKRCDIFILVFLLA